MDSLTAASTALAAAAALLSAISALASWRSTRAVEEEVRLTRAAKRHELVRSFEQDLHGLYDRLWHDIGPWEDTHPVDASLRRTVHDLLQALASVFFAKSLDLVDDEQFAYLSEIFLDWLSTDKATDVWVKVFRSQADTWPTGFVAFVDGHLATRQAAPTDNDLEQRD